MEKVKKLAQYGKSKAWVSRACPFSQYQRKKLKKMKIVGKF
jgi:hypothetical protein